MTRYGYRSRVATDFVRVALGATVGLALSTPAHGEDWVRIETPHFSLLTDEDPRTGRNVALEFERARAVFRNALGIAGEDSLDPALPILIFAVSDRAGLEELLPGVDNPEAFPIGVFQSSPDRHRIAVRLDEPSSRRFQTVYHEYHHLLLRARPESARAPVWLVEGLAEFWSHMDSPRGRGVLSIGRPSPRHLRTLERIGRMPLSRLLRYDGNVHDEAPERIAVFYAQSWALVHHLMLGGEPGTSADVATRGQGRFDPYLERLAAGDDAVATFESVFGSVAGVERALRRYLDQTMFPVLSVEAPDPPSASEFVITEISDAQAGAAVGTFIATGPWPEEASSHLERALELEPENASAMEGMGFLSFRRGELDAAESWFARAAAANEASYLAHYFVGVLTAHRSGSDDVIEASLERAIELNPRFAPAFVALSAELASQANRLERALALAEEATRLAPEASEAWENLSRVLTLLDRPREAEAAAARAKR